MIGLIKSDARFISLKDKTVQCVITSPPYWSLRDYGLPPMVWDGKEGCKHVWVTETRHGITGGTNCKSVGGWAGGSVGKKTHFKEIKSAFCQKCGAWLGCLGLEPQPELYIKHLVSIFREVRRVLRDDGTVFLNMGDSYSGSWGNYMPGGYQGNQRPQTENGKRWERKSYKDTTLRPPSSLLNDNLKPKDLCGIPGDLVRALRADGWWWRSTVVWNKPNPMPESVSGWRYERHRTKVSNRGRGKEEWRAKANVRGVQQDHDKDGSFKQDAEWQDCPGCPKCNPNDGLILRKGSWRPTSSHEYIFMLAKSDTYFCDGEGVREPHKPENIIRAQKGWHGNLCEGHKMGGIKDSEIMGTCHPAGRNLHDVWTISTKPYSGAHFATFNPEIVIPCIKAGTSEEGCCPKCGSAWVRVVERNILESLKDHPYQGEGQLRSNQTPGGQGTDHSTLGGQQHKIERKEMGWLPICDCGLKETVPCVVLDPFGGSGTVAETAKKMGRSAIHLDLTYFPLAKERIWPGGQRELI